MTQIEQHLATVNSLTATKAAKQAALRKIRAFERATGEEVLGPYNGRTTQS